MLPDTFADPIEHLVESHWALSQGAPIPTLSGPIADAFLLAIKSLRRFDPANRVWHTHDQLLAALQLVLTYCGVERDLTVEDEQMRDQPEDERWVEGRFGIEGEKVKEQVGVALRDRETRGMVNDSASSYSWPVNFESILCADNETIANTVAEEVGVEGPGVLWRVFFEAGCIVADRHGDLFRNDNVKASMRSKLKVWMINGGVRRLELLDDLVDRLACSELMAVLVRDGSVDTVEGIRRLRLVNVNSSEITEYFDLRGRSTEGFKDWRYWVWPALQRSLCREACARLLANEESTNEFIIAAWVPHAPVQPDKSEMLAAFRACREFREDREELAARLRALMRTAARDRNGSSSASGRPEIKAAECLAADKAYLSALQEGLDDAGKALLSQLGGGVDLLRQWQTDSGKTAVFGTRESVMLSYNMPTWRIAKGDASGGQEDEEDRVQEENMEAAGDIDMDVGGDAEAGAGQSHSVDQAGDGEKHYTIEGELLDRLLHNIVGDDQPPPRIPTDTARAAWSASIASDISSELHGSRAVDIFMLAVSIRALLDTAEDRDRGRRRGIGLHWVRPTSTAKYNAQWEAKGALQLRDILTLDKDAFEDNLWCLGSFRELYPDLLSPETWTSVFDHLALLLSLAQCSDRFWLYTPAVDFLFDSLTATTDRTMSSEGLCEEDRTATLSLLSTLHDFSNGALLCATIGSRSFVGGLFLICDSH